MKTKKLDLILSLVFIFVLFVIAMCLAILVCSKSFLIGMGFMAVAVILAAVIFPLQADWVAREWKHAEW